MAGLPEKIVELHAGLAGAGLPHAFGGALALAWCTRRARGTIDIDINVFLGVDDCERLFAALPGEVRVTAQDRKILRRDGQVRVCWDRTPLDLFLNTTDYHLEVADRICWESFAGVEIPFIACVDVAVFKAFFNRTKDWADLEEMQAAGTLDVEKVAAIISRYLGPADERIAVLRKLSVA
ncbi:MAG: hypothetical protein OEV14_11595 [Gammaproteobacteria bacterium]|nr:hypothetical protein [Gammaproteobacteria bacterium]